MSIAAFLRLALVAQFSVGVLIAYRFGAPLLTWPLAALAVPIVGSVLVLGLQVLIGAIVDSRQPRLPFATLLPALLTVWISETLVSLQMFCIRQPFFASFPPSPLCRDPHRPAVLLVHGFACNRAVWQPVLRSGLLDEANVATINLEPIFGSIDDYAEPLNDAINGLRTETGAARVTVVCHSMGGLALRCYLRRYGDAAIDRAITIATPHAGTIFAHLAHSRNGRQMARGARFLADLDAALTPQLRARFVCIVSRDDNLIVPRSGTALPGAEVLWFDGIGHLQLLVVPAVWRAVADKVFAPTAAQRSAA